MTVKTKYYMEFFLWLISMALVPLLLGQSVRDPTHCNMITTNETVCHQYRTLGSFQITCPSPPIVECGQICNSAKCNLQCDSPLLCNQTIIAGRGVIAQCKSKTCNQTCVRSGCKMDCTSDNCSQRCEVSGCEIECPAGVKNCIQVCLSGKCIMRCNKGVQFCSQTCIRGKCLMLCNADQCRRSCKESDCLYREKPERLAPDPFGLSLRPLRDCSKPDTDDTCIQNCTEGQCRIANLYGRTERSLQLCTGGNCSFVCKAPLVCNQICTGGSCMRYSCSSEYCVQECIEGSCVMECESKACYQISRGGRTTMRCLPNVDKCHQFCAGGDCKLFCQAKLCYPECKAGGCLTSNIKPRIIALPTRVRCLVTTGECQQNCHTKRSCICRRYYALFHSCDQLCYEGSCRSIKCYTLNRCNQVCEDGQCKSMVCKSNVCVQDCRGPNCEMECQAKNCTQLCPGGGCKMLCTSRVDNCVQACDPKQAECTFDCHAKKCFVTML